MPTVLERRARVKVLEEAGLYLDLTTAKGTFCLSSDRMERACKLLNATEGKVTDDRIFDGMLGKLKRLIEHLLSKRKFSSFFFTISTLNES